MDKKGNQRVALTRRLIQESLLRLLSRKSLFQISIRELCGDAGVNRSTFYRHYGSQFDVLSGLEADYLARVEQTIAAADVRDNRDVLQRVTLVLQYAADNEELSRMLINHNVDPSFSEKLFSLPKIGELLGDALSGQEDERRRRAIVSFAIHGSYTLIQEWINETPRQGAAEQAALILSLARRVCGA